MFFSVDPGNILLVLVLILAPLAGYLIIFVYVKEIAFSPEFARKKLVYETYKRENPELFQQFKKDRRKYYLYWLAWVIEGSLYIFLMLAIRFSMPTMKAYDGNDPFLNPKFLSCSYLMLGAILNLIAGQGQYLGVISNYFAKQSKKYQHFINPLVEKRPFFIRFIGAFILVFLCVLCAIYNWYD